MKAYLDRLKGQLQAAGADCPVFLMHSGGGIISLENAAAFPVRLVVNQGQQAGQYLPQKLLPATSWIRCYPLIWAAQPQKSA